MVGKPPFSAVHRRPPSLREEKAELRAREQKRRVRRILDDGVDAAALGKVAGDRDPGAAAVGAPEQVRLEVAHLVIVEGGVDDRGVARRGLQARDVGAVGHAGKLLDPAPVGAAVLGDLNEAVVGPDVEEPLLSGRFRERDDVSVERRRDVLGDGVDRPDPSHDRELVAVDLARQVGADGLPALTAVVAAEDALRGEIDAGVRMRREDQRGVPVPPQRVLAPGRPAA